MSQNESENSKLLEVYDELALDLDELEAFAVLLGSSDEAIDGDIRPGLQSLLERIHGSIEEKHQVIREVLTQLHEEGAA